MEYRYERKYDLDFLNKAYVILSIKSHPYIFREIYKKRQINNIYFDTPLMKNFNENINGDSNRNKVRIRWYGDTFSETKNPNLEIKSKNGHLGAKTKIALRPFKLKNKSNITDLFNFKKEQDIPENIKKTIKLLRPSLCNSYERIYFQDASKNFRITIDENLQYYSINNSNQINPIAQRAHDKIIMEVKYNKEIDSDFGDMAQFFKFRLSKFSKYVDGINEISYS